jgi:hypothetical protein
LRRKLDLKLISHDRALPQIPLRDAGLVSRPTKDAISAPPR